MSKSATPRLCLLGQQELARDATIIDCEATEKRFSKHQVIARSMTCRYDVHRDVFFGL